MRWRETFVNTREHETTIKSSRASFVAFGFSALRVAYTHLCVGRPFEAEYCGDRFYLKICVAVILKYFFYLYYFISFCLIATKEIENWLNIYIYTDTHWQHSLATKVDRQTHITRWNSVILMLVFYGFIVHRAVSSPALLLFIILFLFFSKFICLCAILVGPKDLKL